MPRWSGHLCFWCQPIVTDPRQWGRSINWLLELPLKVSWKHAVKKWRVSQIWRVRWLRSFRWLIQSMWWRLFDPSDLPPDCKKDSLSSYVRIVDEDESFWPLTPFEFLINVNKARVWSFSWWDHWVLFGFTKIKQDPVWVIRKGITSCSGHQI